MSGESEASEMREMREAGEASEPLDRGGWGAAMDEAFAHAREAYPREACGVLYRDDRSGGGPRAGRWDNAAAARDRFSVERYQELAQLEVLCAAGGEVAVYHSHPDGRAAWSRTDDETWTTPLGPSWPVAHVVIAVTAGAVTAAVGLGWSAPAGRFTERWRWEAR